MLKTLGSFFKSFKQQEKPRELTSAAQLTVGDMLRFTNGFGIPEGLRGETFQILEVATYFYGDKPASQFVIKGASNQPIFLSIEDFDGEESIVISKKLKHKEVDAFFGWKRLRAAMKNEDEREVITQGDITTDEWLSDNYQRQVFGASGQYYEKDVRHASTPPAGGEDFKYYEYYSQERDKSLEIEVWEGDDIEVTIGLVRPMTDVDELWSKS